MWKHFWAATCPSGQKAGHLATLSHEGMVENVSIPDSLVSSNWGFCSDEKKGKKWQARDRRGSVISFTGTLTDIQFVIPHIS